MSPGLLFLQRVADTSGLFHLAVATDEPIDDVFRSLVAHAAHIEDAEPKLCAWCDGTTEAVWASRREAGKA